MNSIGYALARAELIRALTAYSGITTADGAADGTTLVDSNLIDRNDFVTQKTILIMSGDAKDEDKGAALFNSGNGTITLQGTGFSAQIKAGTIFRVLNISTVEIDVANILDRLGPLTVTDNLKAILGAYTAAAPLKAAIDTIAGYLDTEIATILAAVDTEVAAIKTQTDKIAGKMLFSMDFWSEGLEEAQIGDTVAGATVSLPNIVVADLPDGATIVRAILMFKFRMIENTYAGVNKLNGATVAATSQVIQIQDSAASGWADAINFVDDFFTFAEATREGGDVIVGTVDVAGAGKVDALDTYSVRWLLARADQDYLNFNDCQVGLRIWYSL